MKMNLVAETNFQEAAELAYTRDQQRKFGKVEGMLHGIPFSVKDYFDMRGFDTTNGCAA